MSLLKIFKLFIGVLLLPVCIAATQTVFYVIRTTGISSFSEISMSGWWLIAGFALSINTALARMQYALAKLRQELADEYAGFHG